MNESRYQPGDHLFRLLSVLQSGNKFAVTELARQCGSSRRAVLRDIQRLRDRDYPVTVDERSHTCVLLGGSCCPRAIPLGSDEMALLALAVDLSPLKSSPALARRLSASLARLLDLYPSRERQEIDRLLALCEVEGGDAPRRAKSGEALLAILYALMHGKNLRLEFLAEGEAGGARTDRIAPRRLLQAEDGWYLVGRSTASQTAIRLPVRQILQASPIDHQEGRGSPHPASLPWQEG